jgi:hypothetical protein
MVHVDQIAANTLPTIGEQLATRLRRLAEETVPVPSGADITLGDSFALWRLGAEKVGAADVQGWPDLLKLANKLDLWHHQIRVNGKAMAYLHSAPSSTSSTSALFVSPVASSIDKGFAWIRNNVHDNFLVRLLEIPAYHVVTFWMIDELKGTSKVLVISSLVKFIAEQERILTSRELLEGLRNHGRPGGLLSQK